MKGKTDRPTQRHTTNKKKILNHIMIRFKQCWFRTTVLQFKELILWNNIVDSAGLILASLAPGILARWQMLVLIIWSAPDNCGTCHTNLIPLSWSTHPDRALTIGIIYGIGYISHVIGHMALLMVIRLWRQQQQQKCWQWHC